MSGDSKGRGSGITHYLGVYAATGETKHTSVPWVTARASQLECQVLFML